MLRAPYGPSNDSKWIPPRLVTLGMGAFPIPAALPVSRVAESFDEDGNPTDESYEKRAQAFIAEVLWFAEAIAAQKAKDGQ